MNIENQAQSNAQFNAPVQAGQANQGDQAVAQAADSGQFFVRTLNGQCLAFSLNPNMTIAELKRVIQDKQQVPVDQQRLVFSGKQLEDNKTLKDYEIGNDAQLHLVLRLRGGC